MDDNTEEDIDDEEVDQENPKSPLIICENDKCSPKTPAPGSGYDNLFFKFPTPILKSTAAKHSTTATATNFVTKNADKNCLQVPVESSRKPSIAIGGGGFINPLLSSTSTFPTQIPSPIDPPSAPPLALTDIRRGSTRRVSFLGVKNHDSEANNHETSQEERVVPPTSTTNPVVHNTTFHRREYMGTVGAVVTDAVLPLLFLVLHRNTRAATCSLLLCSPEEEAATPHPAGDIVI